MWCFFTTNEAASFVVLAMHEDDDPIWKEILTNEILWVVVAVVGVLILAFHLATT